LQVTVVYIHRALYISDFAVCQTMDTNRKVIICILSIVVISYIFSNNQPNMMKAIMLYDPTEISFFSISWTVGMAAMMLPSIIPVILLYNSQIVGKNDGVRNRSGTAHSCSSLIEKDGSYKQKHRDLALFFSYNCLNIVFTGSYLGIWTIIGIVLLLAWSIPVNYFPAYFHSRDQIQIVFGVVLIISGVYQFSLFKRKFLQYCQSKVFLFERWKSGSSGAFSMGISHGLHCVGSCWPYCLVMICLGWMNVLWMALFASIILLEKIWSEGGIWIARASGIGLLVVGIMSILEVIIIPTNMIM
ncbi:MAG: DUF2182 domain-containing protein, partial [Candidatus Nitrosopolaris sp.]